MKFLVVLAAFAAVVCGYPATSVWTLDQLSNALQNPATDPALIPYLEHALNEIMMAIHLGHDVSSITVVLPPELVSAGGQPDFVDVWPVQTPEEEPSFIDVWPVQTPEEEPSFIDVWPVQTPEEEPSFIDVWPVQIPEAESVNPASPVAPAPVDVQSSSPLVQIIVNVQQASDVSPVLGEIERPVPVQVDEPLPSWGNFI